MKFSMFIHPPKPTPRRTTGVPEASTIEAPSARRKFRDILETYLIASPPMTQRVTIAHIADAAGVSVPTVSKVVNGRADVAPDTRERVERMLREHGYRRPAAPAQASLLDVVFNELESPWAMEIIKGVEEVARENDLGV